MSDERETPVEHVYDGDIHEHDNVLPRWWLLTLFGAIAFAVAYWYGEQQIHRIATPKERFDEEMVAVRLAAAKSGAPMTEATLLGLSHDPATVARGKDTFTSVCAACHRADGGGQIGPNLTDAYWLHGGRPEDVYRTVHDGYPQKGMPSWSGPLGDEKVAAVVAYVMTIERTEVAGGKPPQGDKAE